MAKLTRRKRNELKDNPNKQKKKELSKMEKNGQRSPKKKHVCIFHKYQELQDGTYVCKTCGHHFEKKMGEEKLRKYFMFKNDYSLKELKEMDGRLLKVTYSKNTRGSITEHQIEELAGMQVIKTVCEEWKHFGWVTNDLNFEEDRLFHEKFMCQDTRRKCPEEYWWYPSMEQLEKIFDRENGGYVDIEAFWNTQQRWQYKTSDGKMHWYGVYPILEGCKVEFAFMYYINADPVAARKYVLSKNGELEKVIIRLWNGEIYSLSK